MTDLFGGTIPDRTPEPDPYSGFGQDAKRTAQQKDRIAHGVHPVAKRHGARLPILTTGQTCGDCAHLIVKDIGRERSWLKCVRQLTSGAYPQGPDMRRWWPACTEYEAKP